VSFEKQVLCKIPKFNYWGATRRGALFNSNTVIIQKKKFRNGTEILIYLKGMGGFVRGEM
jgi:hypothetical protein